MTVHPDLKIDYFHNINTKDKAYWLGFLYADATMVEIGTKTRLELELKRKDEESIDRFCDFLGLDKNRKRHRIHEKTERTLVSFACKNITNDLLSHGLKCRKSKIIKYPSLKRRDLELAFLLGYFDGDGKQGTTRLFSGSKLFLKQIKKRFNLKFKVHISKRECRLNGRWIKGVEYYLHLGADLFNEMMENYKDSMPRKRWHPCNLEDKHQRSNEALTPEKRQRRRELQ